MKRAKAGRRVALAAVLCCAMPACNGRATVPTVPPTPTPPPVTDLVASGTQALTAHHFLRIPFTTKQPGKLAATVQWTYTTDVVWVDVAAGDCAITQFQAAQCEFQVASNEATTIAQKTVTVASFAAGTHTLIIDNRGPADESLSYQVTLTN